MVFVDLILFHFFVVYFFIIDWCSVCVCMSREYKHKSLNSLAMAQFSTVNALLGMCICVQTNLCCGTKCHRLLQNSCYVRTTNRMVTRKLKDFIIFRFTELLVLFNADRFNFCVGIPSRMTHKTTNISFEEKCDVLILKMTYFVYAAAAIVVVITPYSSQTA